MKIAGLSDLHGYLPDNIPTCDVLCISGDIIPLQIQRKSFASIRWWLRDFCNWVCRLPCNKVIFTAGNHDIVLERLYKSNLFYKFIALLEQYSNDKAILLINETYTYKGINFYGFPYIRPIPFQEGRWAFEDDYKGKYSESVYNSIPKVDIDVLITHDTPFKNNCLYTIIDTISSQPTIFCGHWHTEDSDNLQKIYNCSIRDDQYNIKKDFKIPVVEVETEKSKIEEIFDTMINNIPMYTALKHYDNFQVNAIKEYLQLNKEFFLKQQEDEIPLPITGEVIEEEHEEDDN